ncbi:hypothetical protein [Maribacter sp. 2304DJ31-5]|uniref:hypothetical protein n=1 Tax=Maribacter sp. 2304DJ31-5 TaxID=3386273 RepID=UPI0039BD3599
MSNISKTLLFFSVFSLMVSCSEDLDFNQYDDLEITPTYEASIFFIKTQESLINRINGINFFSQDFNFDAFEEALFADRVLEGSITYELENTTSKDIEITIEFLDAGDTVLDTELFQMTAAPAAVLLREVIYGNAGKDIDILRNTTTIRLSAGNQGDNTSTSGLPDPALILRSSGKFTLRLK